MEPYAEPREQYRRFADEAADSPCFRDWALAVAEDPEVLAWLADLPAGKAQPNLVLAAARWHGVPAPGPYAALREALLGPASARVRATVLERRTQTNEVRRLATLVPAFAALGLDEPVALLEVGASAGLCLFPDRWGYRWTAPDGRTLAEAPLAGAGELTCTVELHADAAGPPPYPALPPSVAWRGGLDLHPLDVSDPDTAAWLATLVWPEHTDRRELLARAVEVARAEPPDLRAGDLLTDLPPLVEEAAAHGPVVVFHSAVAAYLSAPDRERFHELMTGLVAAGACHWVSNEAPGVLPRVTATGPTPPDTPTFVLGVDGRAVAWTHGHGRSLTWL
ncbi:DUF2332 domain-containing protein [Nocardioides sp. SOB77]|uniref:DUF2332 domain-containing protein n=1 Tax=Nocardioides oceani TaxID=3058369 RepID=A0ABT8FEW3_9ACTN|nr:DUF2332 domain-containing protein [Nocardioides oceani]MDN4173212.1 DUF2332 domain-containing protein [Nocardioides oceani]